MPESFDVRNHPHASLSPGTGRGGNTLRDFFVVALPPLVLLALLTGACYLAAGDGLGLYLAGLALAMTLAPPLVLVRDRRVERVLAVASAVDGVGVVWLVAMFRSDVTFGQWLAAYVLLAACAVGAAGVAAALSRWLGPLFAGAVTTVITLAWLTWPIWLPASVQQRAIGWLVPVHPLLALNGLLVDLGVWGEMPLMYRLTSLGQDVPYNLPASIVACAASHFLLGGALLLVPPAGESRAAVDVPDRDGR